MKPVVPEVAANGITTPGRNPAVPVLASDVSEEILACLYAGASVVHSHGAVRSPDAQEVAEDNALAYRPVLKAFPDAILYPTINTVFFWPVVFGAPVVSEKEMKTIIRNSVDMMMSRYDANRSR